MICARRRVYPASFSHRRLLSIFTFIVCRVYSVTKLPFSSFSPLQRPMINFGVWMASPVVRRRFRLRNESIFYCIFLASFGLRTHLTRMGFIRLFWKGIIP